MIDETEVNASPRACGDVRDRDQRVGWRGKTA